MTELSTSWLSVPLLLALETGLIAGLLALLLRFAWSAAWRRVISQSAVAGVLLLLVVEFTGAAQILTKWLPGSAKLSIIPHADKSVSIRTVRSENAPSDIQTTSEPPSVTAVKSSAPEAELTADTSGWLGILWLAGVVVLGCRACAGRTVFVVFRLRRRTLPNDLLLQRVQMLARSLGISRRVRVILSPGLGTPIAFGILRPTVGLPLDFSDRFDPLQQEAMLAHELAHLAGHDPLWCLAADAAAAILWWHPAIWWIRRQARSAFESAADEASLLVADGPRVLAECLVHFGAQMLQPARLGHLGVSGFKSNLGRRVQQLLCLEGCVWSPPTALKTNLIRVAALGVICAVVILCSAWADRPTSMKGADMKIAWENWKQSLAAVGLIVVAETQTTTADPSKVTDAPPPPPVTDLPGAAPSDASPATIPNKPVETQSRRSSATEMKLESIVLPEITFSGLPLSEVLVILRDQSIELDPDKKGLNFLIDPNSPPPSAMTQIDPTTGLPRSLPSEPLDLSSVLIKFNLPLRNVTIKQALNAIVRVADRRIQYSIEDYGVVFSSRPQDVFPTKAANPFRAPATPRRVVPSAVPAKPAPLPPIEDSAALQWDGKPQIFNIDFGPWRPDPSKQVGPAAAGREGDFWNSVGVAWNDHHTESGMKFATGQRSPIKVEMINLAGGWGNSGKMGVKAPMLDDFNYPQNNQGGNSTVVLHKVPPGKYNVYIYGHGTNPLYNGDYTLTIGERDYGRKLTASDIKAVTNTKWVEGSQYVKFSRVEVKDGETVRILIQPGHVVTDDHDRTFADAMICGLQLVPVK